MTELPSAAWQAAHTWPKDAAPLPRSGLAACAWADNDRAAGAAAPIRMRSVSFRGADGVGLRKMRTAARQGGCRTQNELILQWTMTAEPHMSPEPASTRKPHCRPARNRRQDRPWLAAHRAFPDRSAAAAPPARARRTRDRLRRPPNAGKSTSINTLTQQKRLAFASKTPGRTQSINLFALGKQGVMPCWPTCRWLRRGAQEAAALAAGDGQPPGQPPEPARRRCCATRAWD